MFLVAWWAYMLKLLLRRSTQAFEVVARLRQAQRAVRPTAHLVGIVDILTVVLPEAHRAYLVSTALIESEIAATRAGIRSGADWPTHVEIPPCRHGQHGLTCHTCGFREH